jgi:hypothetical protein
MSDLTWRTIRHYSTAARRSPIVRWRRAAAAVAVVVLSSMAGLAGSSSASTTGPSATATPGAQYGIRLDDGHVRFEGNLQFIDSTHFVMHYAKLSDISCDGMSVKFWIYDQGFGVRRERHVEELAGGCNSSREYSELKFDSFGAAPTTWVQVVAKACHWGECREPGESTDFLKNNSS